MLASDKEYNIEIAVNNRKIYENEIYMDLLTNIGISTDEISMEPDHIAIIDGETIINKDVLNMPDIAEADADIQIMVMERGSSEIIDNVAFAFDTVEDVPDDYLVTSGTFR